MAVPDSRKTYPRKDDEKIVYLKTGNFTNILYNCTANYFSQVFCHAGR